MTRGLYCWKITVPYFSHWTLHQSMYFHSHLDVEPGWRNMLLLEDGIKKLQPRTLCVWSIFPCSISPLGLGKWWNPALQWVHFKQNSTCEHTTPSRGCRALCRWSLPAYSLLFIDKSQLYEMCHRVRQGCCRTSLCAHSLPTISLLFCPCLLSPTLKHNYSFYQLLFIFALPLWSRLFLGKCFVYKKEKKPHSFICDSSLKSELKWEFCHGT